MKILQTQTAPNPRRVRIFLAEKGIEVPYEELDLMKGALKTPEFTKLNPLQRVPVLVLDDGTRHRRDHRHLPLFRGDAAPTGAVRHRRAGSGPRWKCGTGAWRSTCSSAWRRRSAICIRPWRSSRCRRCRRGARPTSPGCWKCSRPWTAELATRPYIAGDAFSVADITALVAVDFMRAARIQRPPELKHLERWHGEMSARPSAKA